MRVALFRSRLTVQHAAVDAQAYSEYIDFRLSQNSGPIDLFCNFYST